MITSPKPLIIADIFNCIHKPDELDWRPFRPGVELYPIHGDIRDSSSAALLRYQPGAKVPVHTHPGYEYLLILSGSQSDGSNTFHAGSLIVNYPGSVHAIHSEEGCIVLLIWEKPVEFENS